MADPKATPEAAPQDPRRVDAPEAHNQGQDDEQAQAQSLADEILAARGQGDAARNDAETPVDGLLSDSVKPTVGDVQDDVPDMVDRMNQMETSGHIDNDAYRGERNDDDEEGSLGREKSEDRRRPRGAE